MPLERDIDKLLLEDLNAQVFISGLLSPPQEDEEPIDATLALNTCLESMCFLHKPNFIDNCNLLWECTRLFNSDGNPSPEGKRLFNFNLLHAGRHPFTQISTRTASEKHKDGDKTRTAQTTETEDHRSSHKFPTLQPPLPLITPLPMTPPLPRLPPSLPSSLFLPNIRALKQKSFLIHDLIQKNYLNCVLLVDRWLDNVTGMATLIETCPPNFKFYQSTRQSGRGGGIAAIISTQLVSSDIDLGKFSPFKYLAVELKTELSVLSVTLYWPPRYSSLFLQEFSEQISNCITRYDRLILHGDLNININKKDDKQTLQSVLLKEG